MDVELVLDAQAINGESPVWSVAEQALYWIDVKEPALHRFDPATRADRRWPMTADIGAFALAEGGGAIVALRSGVFRLDVRTGGLRKLAEAPFDPRTHRFNDGKCDAAGRFWIGVMHEPEDGAGDAPRRDLPVQVFGPDGALRAAPATATIANGLAWSPDQRVMYFADSATGLVSCFDFDPQAGMLSGRRDFVRLDPQRGKPDGAAIDADGFYWTALYGGSRLARFSTDGRLDREIALPARQPTMCAFGGPTLEELFVTSAAKGCEGEPQAGGLFVCRPGVRGLAPHLFAG